MERPVIYYFYDILCGWCYGFSPVIQRFYKEQKEHFDFRVISGGMVIGEREGPIGEVAGYIRKAYRDVEEKTGVKFGQAFLDGPLKKGSMQFTSLPGALAMATFRLYQPDNVIPFAARLQKAIYDEGLPPAEAKTFGHCAEDFGMNASDFMRLMVQKEKLELVMKEFKLVQEWGIQGFPAVVYQKEQKGYLITRGFLNYQQLSENFKKVREEVA